MIQRITAVLLVLLLAHPAQASLSSRLEALRRKLEALRHALVHTDSDRSRQRAALRRAEQKLGRAAFRIHRLRQQQRLLTAQQAALRAQVAQEETALIASRHVLALDLRTAYALHSRNYWQLLLDQKRPARIRRMLTYYRYVSDALGLEIHQTEAAMAQLVSNQNRLQQGATELNTLSATQASEEQGLLRDKARRRTALSALDRKAATQQQQLRRLRAATRRLQHLVTRLRSRRRPLRIPATVSGPFGRNRGHLRVPVGVPRWPDPGVRTGAGGAALFIPVPTGTRVHAVFGGRVAYADWLRGFGLMLILEHEGGYMTIYAHAQSLFVHAGDVVVAGQVIAAAGKSGGFREPGLYFEIRHNGRPLPALDWLRR